MLVITLTELKREVGWPYSRLCESVGLSYASFRLPQIGRASCRERVSFLV